jgi:tripartite-type tricarboxylate transporter receptor subunit TctC
MQAQLAAGSVRAIAVASRQRLAALPEVPTFEQAGMPGYDATNWFGIQAPKGVNAELVRTLNEHFNRASNDPGLQKRYADAGILPIRESVEVFQRRIQDDHVRWREVVRTAGIKSD